MSRGKNELDRAALIAALDVDVGRKATMAILAFYNALADRLGANLTDMICGELISRTGPITAGELAALTGLTTGAITGVVDRLEKNGFVRRENDPADRRRVILRPLPDQWERGGAIYYKGLHKRFEEVFALYSDEELSAITDFLEQLSEAYDQEAVLLRGGAVTEERASDQQEPDSRARADGSAEPEALIKVHIPKRGKEMAAPLRDIRAGRLDWDSGPSEIHLSALRDGTDLYRARFDGDVPTVRVQGGTIGIQYRQRSLFGRAGGKAEVKLNASVPWTIDLHSDSSKLEADLRTLVLLEGNLRSNSSKIHLNLPAPQGTVTLRVESDTSKVTIQRPSGVPARVELDGNWSRLTFDKHNKGAMRTEAVESPGYKRADARYVIQIVGGSNQIRVDSV